MDSFNRETGDSTTILFLNLKIAVLKSFIETEFVYFTVILKVPKMMVIKIMMLLVIMEIKGIYILSLVLEEMLNNFTKTLKMGKKTEFL